MIGADHDNLFTRLTEATRYRNKILHGQLTPDSLGRQDLLDYVRDIRRWCELLAAGAQADLSYDGCSDSFQKSAAPNLAARLNVQMMSVADYEAFITAHMER